MKKYLLILFLLPAQLFAQVVSNVLQRQEDDKICIYYDLSKEAYISLQYSVDGGQTFLPVNNNYLWGIGYNYGGNNKKITWRVLEQYSVFIYDDVRFKVVATPISYVTENVTQESYSQKKTHSSYNEFNPSPDKHRFYLLADFAWATCPQYSGGFMLGTVKKWGWYMKLHLSFTPSHRAPKSDSDLGILERRSYLTSSTELYIPAYTGKDDRFEIVLTAGFVARLGIPIYAYSGLGYGSRQLYWGTADAGWVNMTQHSYRGIAVDAGLMYDIWHIRLKTGITTINFKYLEYDFGLGYVF